MRKGRLTYGLFLSVSRLSAKNMFPSRSAWDWLCCVDGCVLAWRLGTVVMERS